MSTQIKNTLNEPKAWSKEQFTRLFEQFDVEVKMFGAVPVPANPNIKFYQRCVYAIDPEATAAVKMPWIKVIVKIYEYYREGNSDWFERFLQVKKPEPVQPVHTKCEAEPAVAAAVPIDHIVEAVSEKLNDHLQNLGQSMAAVLKSMNRDTVKQLADDQIAQRKVLDSKFLSLEHSILSALNERIKSEVERAVEASLGTVTSIILESVVSKLPDHISSTLNSLVDNRIEEIFGEDEKSPAPESVVIPQEKSVDLSVLVDSDKSVFRAKPVQPKKVAAQETTLNGPMKILVLDLSKDQMSHVRNGISERWVVIDQGTAAELTDSIVGRYDIVIGTQYTNKADGKNAAARWPNKYQLVGGGYFKVRGVIKRVADEYRRDSGY